MAAVDIMHRLPPKLINNSGPAFSPPSLILNHLPTACLTVAVINHFLPGRALRWVSSVILPYWDIPVSLCRIALQLLSLSGKNTLSTWLQPFHFFIQDQLTEGTLMFMEATSTGMVLTETI